MKHQETNIKAHFKGEPVILKDNVYGWYYALRLSTQEYIWIKANSKHLEIDEVMKCNQN